MSGWTRAAAVARKDLRAEWRGRAVALTMLLAGLLLVLVLGVALGPEPARAAAVVWVSAACAAAVGIPRITQAEADQQALEALLLYPGRREHLYWGKAAALAVLLGGVVAVLLILAAFLFGLPVAARLPQLAAVGGAGVAALAALGTLVAGLLLHVRGRELLAPLLMLPLALPPVLACIRLTEAVLAGAPAGVWPGVLAGSVAVFVLACPILFEAVMDEV
ncbi:MAG: heme exporter protein CcmB [Armatimonadota bacterium]|nr:heme exporter protein CcmB [Armatimonadota bacterium]MDR7402410.1 heme exporter protein CcmB [Armatimonadota bacterium]MDR7404250.1 heme exporter protein CcmB [Armatimonadota bacterium]MDR7437569.1 heme exporter protein CcmB [Armatimonadota bacterium]MDR7472163.1 heme exporter protein CcmB [Armatimonadota bacterium]